MNKRPMWAFAALCLVAGGAVAQTPPAPARAPKAVPAPRVVVPPVVIPPIDIPPIDIPPVAPMMLDVQMAMDMIQPGLAAARMALQSADLDRVNLRLQEMAPALSALDAMPAMAPMPAMPAMPAFGGMTMDADREMAMADRAMAAADRVLARRGRGVHRGSSLLSEPPEPTGQQDVGDSLYRAARTALDRGSYDNAARLFRTLRDRYQRSTYVADSYYWEAYALYRQGGSTESYRQAVRVLDDQKSRFPRAATRGDSEQLRVRLLGELAQRGDPDARRQVDAAARGAGDSSSCTRRDDDDDDVRVAALNALMQMNSDDAMPVLRQVLAKRDACSALLRRKAVMIVAMKRGAETEDILLGAARNDPDHDVRMTAVQWLGNVTTDRSANALDSIIRSTQDDELRERAIQSLAQHRNPLAGQLLRAYVTQGAGSDEARETAISALAIYRRSPENSQFLRDQYKRTTSRRVRERIVQFIGQAGGSDNAQFLMGVALDDQEQPETRRMALYSVSQNRLVSFDSLAGLYDRVQDHDMKAVLLSVYAQRRGGEGVDKLIDIVKKEKDRELRNRAVQYLGQSRDPKAAQFLAQLINQ